MLKKLSKKGEYTHILVISIILILYYLTPPVPLSQNGQSLSLGPVGVWLTKQALINTYITRISIILLMVFISFYVNRLAASSDIFPKQSFLSATLLIAMFLFSPGIEAFSLSIVLILSLSICLGSMIKIFGKQYPYLQILNASMSIAIASMIVPHTIIFILFIWFGFLTYSVNSWREWIISIIGIIIPYLYMLFAYYWNNNLEYVVKLYQGIYFFNFFHYTLPTTYILISLSILIVLYIVSAFNFTNEASDKIISIRKRMWLIFQFSIVCITILVLLSGSAYILLPVLFIPLSLMISYSVHNQKHSRMFDIFMVLFVVSILISRIFA